MDDVMQQSTDLAQDYRAKAEAIQVIASAAGPQGWQRPSPCEEWSARDVIDHLVDTQRDFLGERGLSVPEGDADDPAQRWRGHYRAVADLLADPSVGGTAYDGYFGPTTIGETLAQFYGWDMLVHRWDVGRALSSEVTFTDRELDEIEAALPVFGEQLYTEGICAPAVQVGPDQPRQVQVLARLGRDAR
ncbi:MAG: maleylpyruvate isomerase family mycothiol-dependent enzyme [Ornithinimicrobium sp.]|uniref:maleylpyruvate isomerase family mycothiol-dependent enzyme n=1 Tax=Ornithinimicrobium sp. TaxID=1977084 RepID=UPI003D9B04CD